jgi:hypothetical protein
MAVTWQVTGDTPGQYDMDAAGNPVTGHVIAFTTGAGNRGTVFVPDQHYNAASVKALVAAQAAIVDEISSLKSS